jgi:HK97 gp10 family phage protein
MGFLSVDIQLDTSGLDRRLRQMPARIQVARRQAAENIKQGAANRSRVRTGKMQKGWSVEHGAEESTVSNGVPYTIFNEYGTSRMSAQPMLTPAVEEERSKFVEAIRAEIEVEP